MDDLDYIGRRPRHAALDTATCQITLQWPGSPFACQAELADVSRRGANLILAAEIPVHARVQLQLEQSANQFRVTLPVSIRWTRQLPDGRWTAGCIFDRELSWELLGELFLNGILSPDTLCADERTELVRSPSH